MLGEHSHGVGAGAEERGMTKGDDPGIAEREIEREREEDRDQQLRAESEIVRECEIEGEGEDPGDRLPDPQPVTADQGERRRVLGQSRRGRDHVAFLPNRPSGRQSRSRIVKAKMKSVPPWGRYFLSAKSSTPIRSAA